MPLVGGNELSFFSISFTICFYLVINESSVWWQQAAGCLLAAALSSHTACQTSLCFLYTHMQMQPTMQTRHMHTTTYSYCSMYMFFSLLHSESRMQQQNAAFHTPALFHIHIISYITSIIPMVLLSPKTIFVIIFNYP